MNIIEAMQDKNLFGRTFKPRLLRGDTWGAWRLFLAILFGLPVDEETRALITKHTGRGDIPNTEAFTEAHAISGRRGGKSIISALVVAFVACLRDYSDVLAPGETGVVLILASDRKQAGVIFGYVRALIEGALALRKMIVNITKESIELANNVTISIQTSSYKAVRGYSIVACVCDELAFWEAADSSNPAAEILNAVRPGMSSIPGAILLGLSSPYSKRGALFDIFRANYGRDGSDVLVWKATSLEMNPTISQTLIARSRLSDPARARSEWDAEFREDLEGFISLEIVEARIVSHRHELSRKSGVNYVGFVDPSGGRADSMVLGIAHLEGSVSVLDLLREITAPFSPDDAVKEFGGILKDYGVGTVIGDAYAGDWPRDGFRKQGIQYRVADKNRSELYLELLPLLMSGRCELLDNPRLKNQLVGLERRTGRSGKDAIDHTPGLHDDVANACAGVLFEASGKVVVLGWNELVLREAAKQNPTPAGERQQVIIKYEEANDGCPRCHSNRFVKADPLGVFWRCNSCHLEWRGPQPTGGHEPPLASPSSAAGAAETCANCGRHGIARRGPLLICSHCGVSWRAPDQSVTPRPPNRRGLGIPDSVNRNLKPNPFSW